MKSNNKWNKCFTIKKDANRLAEKPPMLGHAPDGWPSRERMELDSTAKRANGVCILGVKR